MAFCCIKNWFRKIEAVGFALEKEGTSWFGIGRKKAMGAQWSLYILQEGYISHFIFEFYFQLKNKLL